MSVSRARTSSYDIVLDGDLGLMLYLDPTRTGNNPAAASGSSASTEGTGVGAIQPVSTFDDFSGGMGHSRRTQESPNTYDYAIGVCTRYQGLAMPAGEIVERPTRDWGVASGDTVVAGREFRDGLWLVTSGRQTIEYDNFAAGTSFNSYDGGTGWKGISAEIFEGSLWLGTSNAGSTNGLREITSAGAVNNYGIHRGALAVVYWVVKGVGGYRLVATSSSGETVRHCATAPGVALNWTDEISLASDGFGSLVASNRHVYVVMSDGIRDVDARGYVPNITPYWRQNQSDDSGRAALIHDGRLIASHFEGIDSVDITSGARQDVPTWIDPIHTLPFEGPVRGTCTALATERGWLVAALFDGTDSYLCYGAPRERLGIPGRGPYVWHGAEAVFRSQKITWMKVVSLDAGDESQPRLWIATLDLTTDLPRLFIQSLPQFGTPYSDFKAGAAMRFITTGASLFLGADGGGDGAARKILTSHSIGSENLNTAGNNLVLSTSADGETEVVQGTATESPRAVFRAPLTAGNLLRHRIDFNSQRGSPAILRSLRSRYEVVTDQTVHRHYRVLIGASTQQLGSARPRADARRTFRRLLQLQNADPVTMTDELGERLVVKVQAGSVKWTTIKDETGGGFSRVVEFDITEIKRPAYYNAGFRYDDLELYG